MEADFSGWATKAGIKCSDGRTIMPDAFKHQDKIQVPLVWQHGHTDPENVLGHAILHHRAEGVWAECFFNNTPKAQHTKEVVRHKDVKSLSIWANELLERAGRVLHGMIKEVSIVLSGANPGALIENVTIRHSDGDELVLEDEVIIYSGEQLELAHADGDTNQSTDDSDETIEDVYDTLTDKQKNLVHYVVAQAIAKDNPDNADDNGSVSQSDLEHTNQEGTGVTTKNVFEQGADNGQVAKGVLSHSDMLGIIEDAKKPGSSLKHAINGYCLAHGINDISTLFPEATPMTAAPEFYGRRTEWVDGVLSGANKTPFSRVKTHWADLNFDDARAKGYIKGNMKKEEFFGTASRTTTPKTIYKKQKLDRDDILDITDFDVVAWMRGEMRLMLEEEIARAILIGDGRAVDDEDKINVLNLRPIADDDEMYAVSVYVNIDDANSTMTEVLDQLTLNRQYYRGSGTPTFYTTETTLAKFLLIRDTLGRRIYPTVESLASEMRVKAIVTVEVMESRPEIVGILVNMSDYTIGADKGGQITNFDDFDIDFNQYKYLIETRISGALTKLKSALVVKRTTSTNVLVATINAPTFNTETGVVTIVATTGVVYKNADTLATLSTGAQAALADGATLNVLATPASGYYFGSSEGDYWSFTYHADV